MHLWFNFKKIFEVSINYELIRWNKIGIDDHICFVFSYNVIHQIESGQFFFIIIKLVRKIAMLNLSLP